MTFASASRVGLTKTLSNAFGTFELKVSDVSGNFKLDSGLSLDFSKIEAGKVDIERIPFNIIDLVKQINDMNSGIYLDDEMKDASPTDFCMGIAGYPEKHFESPNLATDIEYLKQKIDAGASYIVTQMFFDNANFFRFRDACEKAGINVPIVPGLKPITKKYQLNSIPRKFFINLPEDLVSELHKTEEKDIKKLGIEWCINQCKELKASGVPCLHFYTMGDVDTTYKIVEKI